MSLRLSPERLVAARKGADFTQQQAAAHIKVALSTLQAAEYGRHEPRASVVAQLAALYRVDMDSLFISHPMESIDPEGPLRHAPNGGIADDGEAA